MDVVEHLLKPGGAEERFHLRDITVIGSAVGNEGAHLTEKVSGFLAAIAASPCHAAVRKVRGTRVGDALQTVFNLDRGIGGQASSQTEPIRFNEL
ncbi:MAG TPA: hypothetical protein VIT21_05845 [Chthoniobacterales bacterium]